MKSNARRAKRELTSAASASSILDPTWLAEATSEQLGALFRNLPTLPLDQLLNSDRHEVDVATRTIFNDELWKGWLPRGLRLRDITTRLSTGYAKRFWKRGKRVLGETVYLDGRIRLKHSLEEITLDRPTNDLDPGTYILLRYTDPVFEHLFYDVMRAGNDGVIVYGGYTGRYPEGKRGFTAVLMRRYAFEQLGARDHQYMFQKGARISSGELKGTWRLSVVTTADHATPIGDVTFARGADGKTSARCTAVSNPEVLVPSFVLDHFSVSDAASLEKELRRVDGRTIVGRWSADVGPLYAKFLTAAPGLFHREMERGKRRHILRYTLSGGK